MVVYCGKPLSRATRRAASTSRSGIAIKAVSSAFRHLSSEAEIPASQNRTRRRSSWIKIRAVSDSFGISLVRLGIDPDLSRFRRQLVAPRPTRPAFEKPRISGLSHQPFDQDIHRDPEVLS